MLLTLKTASEKSIWCVDIAKAYRLHARMMQHEKTLFLCFFSLSILSLFIHLIADSQCDYIILILLVITTEWLTWWAMSSIKVTDDEEARWWWYGDERKGVQNAGTCGIAYRKFQPSGILGREVTRCQRSQESQGVQDAWRLELSVCYPTCTAFLHAFPLITVPPSSHFLIVCNFDTAHCSPGKSLCSNNL